MVDFGPFKKELTVEANSPDGKDSIDYYFSNGKRFCRWRQSHESDGSQTWELTSKKRTNSINNNIRVEVNLPLVAEGMNFEKAKLFSELHSLSFDFAIKKSAKVIWVDKVVISHYSTYNMKNKLLDTWLEVEADEHYPWANEAEAMAEVLDWEKRFAVLGITPQLRIKRSLFEIYSNFT